LTLHRLEQLLGRDDVIAHVTLESRSPTRPNPRLAREVENDVDFRDDLVEIAPGKINRQKHETVPIARLLQVPELLGAAVIVVEAVHAEDVVSVRQQRFGQVRSDEASTSGDESAHQRSLTQSGADRSRAQRQAGVPPFATLRPVCGICGIIGPTAPADPESIRKMTAVLAHRGPDGEGHCQVRSPDGTDAGWLGHRRLRIIDLTDAAHQPMTGRGGAVALTYNGEIYNFRELRNELSCRGHAFNSTGDTEIVLRAYEEWGDDCVKHLDGMFAFAIWDRRDGHLLLARDRPGKKPLFYSATDERVTFGSEIKALRAGGVIADVAVPVLAQYLTFGYVPHPETITRGVQQVPPGSTVIWRPGHPAEVSRFWEPDFPARSSGFRRPGNGFLAEVRERFSTATARRMVADVPVGAFLSGGLDSSLVVAAMREHARGDVHTFSIGFPDDAASDERRYARIIAEHFQTNHTEFAVRADAVALLDTLVWHYDEPFADCSAIPTYIVSQLAAPHVKVVLNGDGGDEIFGGYDRFRAAAIARMIPPSIAPIGRRAARVMPASSGYYSTRRRLVRFFEAAEQPLLERYISWISVLPTSRITPFLTPEVLAETPGSPDDAFRVEYETHSGLPILDRLLAANFATNLPDDLAVKMDRMSMANSIETRSPFLDTALIDLLATVPASRKVGLRRVKPILRKAFRSRLPEVIWNRRKQGFGPPMHAWFRGPLAPVFEDEVLGPNALSARYLQRNAVRRMYESHRAGTSDEGFRLWPLLTFERWLRTLEAPLTSPPARPVLDA
jgi:asparagine synthase (glutamine-hydrolysing)